MGGHALPRRIAFALAFAATAAFAGFASAQSRDPNARTDVNSNPRVVLGSANAHACGRYAAAGDGSDAALQACDRALTNEGLQREGELATRINRGVVYLRRRNGQAALTDFDFVIGRDPDHAEAYVNRGSALMMLDQPGPAVAAFTDALVRGVDEPHQAYYNRGAAREALGDLRGAYEDYSTALEIEPDWGPANAELARFVRNRRERVGAFLAARGGGEDDDDNQ
jgi:tetratricopeptide (TPR) repeat protein